MPEKSAFVDVLQSFVSSMAHSYDRVEMCYQLCDHTVDVLGVAGAGVAVIDQDQQLRFVTATNENIIAIEETQESEQQGPCVEAFRTQTIVSIEEIQALDRWPVYKSVAADLGLRSVLGVPLSTNTQHLGAFNVYHDEVRAWTSDELAIARVLSDMATAYLVRTSELSEARRVTEQLQGALDSRVVIEQAKGILAGAKGITVDEAFELLRAHARNNNLPLAELAGAVVNMGLQIPGPSK